MTRLPLGESQRERTSAAMEICPPPRWWSRDRIATSAVGAGIHVQDRTVHAPLPDSPKAFGVSRACDISRGHSRGRQ
jgi:hypothetical protein